MYYFRMSGRLSSLSALLQHSKLRQIPVSVDGNSFYKAISQAYYKSQDFHLLLRKTVVEDILHNTSNYTRYFPVFSTSDSELVVAREKDAWNPSLARLLAFAISENLNIRLEIYSIQEDDTIQKQVFLAKQSSQTIRLLKHKHKHCYELLSKFKG